MYKKRLILILFAVLVGLGVCLRLWHLKELFHFTFDEEVIAFVGKRMFVNGHIPLIGGVTPMHVHLAPYFYWFSGLLLYLSHLNPIGWGVAAAFLAGITMISLFLLGKRLFGWRTGLLATVFYAFSFYQNIFDRHYWGLVFNGIISVSVILALFEIKKGKQKYAYVLALLLAFGFHTDPSTLVLIVLSVISLVLLKMPVTKRTFLISLSLFLLSFLPLIIFDAKHNFSNISGIKQYISDIKIGKKGSIYYLPPSQALLFVPRVLAKTLYTPGETDLARQYSYCSQHAISRVTEVPWYLTILVLAIFVVAFFKAKSETENSRIGLRLILLLFLSLYLGISLYSLIFKGDLFDHYLSTGFPLFLLLTAYVSELVWRKNKFIAIFGITIFVGLNLSTLAHAHHRFGYFDKEKAVEWAIKATGSDEISLDALSSCFRYNGYRYMFYLYGKEPRKSYVDANFTYLYDEPPASYHPRYLVVIANPDFKETPQYFERLRALKTQLVTEATFGNTEVLVVDNQNGKFINDY